MKKASYIVLLILLVGTTTSLRADDPRPAFPGAEGFGAEVTGGRGGEVYHVTNLNDSGSGSLRDAVSRGPRIVVFDVGGYINLQSTLSVHSNVTIAGQTAPGDGIGTKNYEVSFSGSHNVIIRYIRFRQGLTSGQDRKSAVNITRGSDMIFDHVSIEWGRWDTIDMNGSTNITFQNSIIGEGIFYDDNKNGQLDGRPTTDRDLGPVTTLTTPFADPPIPVTVDTAQDAYDTVVADAGASLQRDAVDARLIDDLTSLGRDGRIISDPMEVGGFGTLRGGTPPPSCTSDGIPDDWKLQYGLDPCTYAANGDFDGTGYTNIEKYINGIVDGSYPY